MRGKTVLFFDPDPRTCRVAGRALHATGSEVEVVDELRAALRCLEDHSYDLVMTSCDPGVEDVASLIQHFDKHRERSPDTEFVLHVTASTEDYLPILEGRRYIRNLIAKNSDPLEPDELIITAEKLLRKDLFGLQKYLLWGVEPLRLTIGESRKKPDYLEQVARYADALGCGSRTIELIEGIVDELITNAIFNAPCNPDGTPKYRDLHRSEAVVLDDREVAELHFACDGDFIAIASIDPFGSLTQETVVSYLARCFERGPRQLSEDSGGAGLGLYHVFQSLSKFVINLEPGRRTEVISLIDLRLSMKQFREAAKSFHFFVDDRDGA